MYTETERNRFFSKIKNNNDLKPDECWEWNGSNYFCGSGIAKVAYEMFCGVKPQNRIHRICNNKICVNPHHMLVISTPEYFWHFVDIKGDDECWEWQANLCKDEYGKLRYSNKHQKAHRVAYQIYHNVYLVPEQLICHTCDNTKCCNPHHLFIGNNNDNMFDMVDKGRSLFGSKHHNTSLLESDVINIRSLTKSMSNVDIAKIYNIKPYVISKIKRRITWTHI